MTYIEFRRQWLLHFAKGISDKDIKNYVVSTGNHIWHIFSWGLLSKSCFLEGDTARKAFDNLSIYVKENAIYIEPFERGGSFSLTQKKVTSAMLDEHTEIFAVARDFSWTYIKTHEGNLCGPYFYRPKL